MELGLYWLCQAGAFVAGLYKWVLIVAALASWVIDPYTPLARNLRRVSDPPCRLIRPLLPVSVRALPVDISFLVLLVLVSFTEGILQDLAFRLRPGLLLR